MRKSNISSSNVHNSVENFVAGAGIRTRASRVKHRFLLHFYGDCTIASLTISDVHLVYCEVDMPIGTPSL